MGAMESSEGEIPKFPVQLPDTSTRLTPNLDQSTLPSHRHMSYNTK